MTVVVAVGHGRRAARVMHRWLTEGKAYLNDEDAMEDIVNNLGVFDDKENVGILGGLHREHQPKVGGAERARKLRGDRTGHAREPGGARGRALPALLPGGAWWPSTDGLRQND